MRCEFTMTQAQLGAVLDACKPTPCMYLSGGQRMGPTPQENANAASGKQTDPERFDAQPLPHAACPVASAVRWALFLLEGKLMNPKPVLVTTAHRGVFFGYVTEDAMANLPQELSLTNARNCLYWDPSNKGFLGLAVSGPTSNCRVGPYANVTLFDITSVSDVSEEAVTRWEAAPWK